MTPTTALGVRLLEESGGSVARLAGLAGVSRQALTELIQPSPGHDPSVRTLEAVAALLGISEGHVLRLYRTPATGAAHEPDARAGGRARMARLAASERARLGRLGADGKHHPADERQLALKETG